nr:hypothetical protein [Pandoravirus aubagnensis]
MERKNLHPPHIRDSENSRFFASLPKSRLSRTDEPPKDSRQQTICARKEKKRVVHENFWCAFFPRLRPTFEVVDLRMDALFFPLGRRDGTRTIQKKKRKTRCVALFCWDPGHGHIPLRDGVTPCFFLYAFFRKKKENAKRIAQTQGKIATAQARPTGIGLFTRPS